jgi:N-acetyl-beta-hexosaminidase
MAKKNNERRSYTKEFKTEAVALAEMKKPACLLLTVVLAAFFLYFASCASTKGAITDVSIVPQPLKYVQMPGEFKLSGESRIVVRADGKYNEVRQNIAEYLALILRTSTGFSVKIAGERENHAEGDILLVLASSGAARGEAYSSEAYTLKVETKTITLTANEQAGLFRGVQTLRQLFGPDIETKNTVPDKKWSAACCEITDSPAYKHRGLMIDVARHFFPKEVIMRQIDLASQYKINTIHLHLSDDQGWRIEIKSRPALTEIGSLGAVKGGKGGYYTQDDFREIVKYAAARYIEVIPEIDMPGHVNAALVSIPELNPDSKAPKPRTDTEVGYSTLQCRSEATYQFCEDVIRELAEISPSK